MKIALVSPYAWTTPGGVNAHVAGLAEHLRARGHEVRILAPADGETGPGVISLGRTVGVPYNGSVARLAFGPRVAGRVRVALRRAKPDVVHVHEPFAPSTSMLAALAAHVPVVATFHAAVESRVYRAARAPLGPLWRRIAIKIAVSQSARDTVEAVFGPGVRIIPNGVEAARFAVVEPHLDAAVVLYFGRLEARKGPQVLMAALPELVRAVPDVRVVVAGEGPLRANLEAAVAPEHAAHVSFVGRFDESERLGLLSSASVACLPAVGGESFGITLVEAMASGLPVVATTIPGYASVARDGEDALLVAPGEPDALARALVAVVRDPALARRLGAGGRAHAARFDWAIVGAEIESVYEEAIQRPPRPKRRRAAREPL